MDQIQSLPLRAETMIRSPRNEFLREGKMAKRQITRDPQSELDWAGDGRRNGMKRPNEEKIARGLGWFSLGLGLAGIVAPRRLAKLIGLRGDHNVLFRVLGAREITSGVGILAGRRPNSNWMWS